MGKLTYKGRIKEVLLKNLRIGGGATFPFCNFDGESPPAPAFAIEVYDAPILLPPYLEEELGDVVKDAAHWAKRVEEDADLICLQLQSTDPVRENTSAPDAARLAARVQEAVGKPLIVYGSGNVEKDQEVLKEVAKVLSSPCIIGPAKEENYKTIAATALAYGHYVVAQTPLDVNLAKQLNILIENLGFPPERIIMDPTVGALGYGLEYAYSIIERDKEAALIGGDEKLACPIICDMGKEVYKAKEVKVQMEELGSFGERAFVWEALTALTLAVAGADIIVMRRPSVVRSVRKILNELRGS
jgi:CO dehydrogenase/acetyl-CoA synthase delta subunit